MAMQARFDCRNQERFDWYGLVSGALFLALSTYMRVRFVFGSGGLALVLAVVAIELAILTVIFGLVTLPRWQSWIALGIFAYVIYWLFFTPIYGITAWV